MTHEFRVIEVFRPKQRRGPILVGRFASAMIELGTELVSVTDPTKRFRIIAIDFHTPKAMGEEQLAVVVDRDSPGVLVGGARFRIEAP